MALPPTVTGAVTGAVTWVPLATPSSPPVIPAAPGTPVLAAPAVEPAGAAPVVSLSPRSEMALSVTVIGTSTLTSPCVPDRSPSMPEVETAGAWGAAGAGAVAP